MAAPVPLASRLARARAALSRLTVVTLVAAIGSALLFVLALFGLLPPRAPEPPVQMAYDPALAVDPPRPLARESEPLPAHRLMSWSFSLCQAPERGATLYPLELRRDRSSFVVFCQGEYVLYELEPSAAPPRVTRLARFPHRGELAGGATALDLDGDGALDLVLGVSPREGVVHRPPAGLYWLRGRSGGGYEPARALIEMPVIAAVAAELDGAGTLELVALTRGDPAAQRAGELWIFSGGISPTRAAVVPLALAPGDLWVGAQREDARELWGLSRQPGSLVRLRVPRAKEAWGQAVRDALPLLGAQAFVRGGARLYVRDAEKLHAVEPSDPPQLAPSGLGVQGPAVWLDEPGAAQPRLLAARAGGFTLQRAGDDAPRVRTLPTGKTLVDVAIAHGEKQEPHGLLLLRSEEQPPMLLLVVLPGELRDEASELELRSGTVQAVSGEARVPLE